MSGWRRQVAIGSFVCDLDGSDFRVSQVQGWEDGAPIRSTLEDRSQQDGAWDAVSFRGPRVITVTGRVEQASRADALAVLDLLNGIDVRSLHQFVVDDPYLGERSAMVRVTAPPVVEWKSPVGFNYSVTVTAPDPTKYGPETFTQTTLAAAAGGAGLVYPLAYPIDYGTAPGVVPGAITLPNAGSASYHPRLRIDGGVTRPRLTLAETGDSVFLDFTIPAGQWVDFNAGKPREVLLNGLVSLRHKTTFVGNALAVPVGGGSLTWTADAYTTSHTLSVWGYERADQ